MKPMIDVEQLLVWAYRDECVGRNTGTPYLTASLSNPIYGMGMLGTRVDSSGDSATRYPEDALLVEAAVLKLPSHERLLVEMHATAGTRPDVKRVPIEAFPTDAWGERSTRPRHMFSPADRSKRSPIACFVGFDGDSLEMLRSKWVTWMDWWLALQAVDKALRTGRQMLKTWELADFSVPQYPWETDPAVPQWLWMRVFLHRH